MKRLALFVLLAAAGAAYAGKFRWHEMQEGDGTNNFQIYILGDGWRQEEMDAYHAAANAAVESLWAIRPYDYIRHMLRITCVDVVSRVSGVNIFSLTKDYKENPGEERDKINARNSPLQVAFQDPNSDPTLDSIGGPLDDELGKGWTGIAIILINEPQIQAGRAKQLGTRFAVGVSAHKGGNAGVGDVLAHEMGHAFFALADEYCHERKSVGKLELEPPNLTITTDMGKRKWRHIPGSNLHPCVPPGTANDYRHAFVSCRMQRPPYPKDFCAVCLEAMTQEASAKYVPIVSHSPPSKDTVYLHALSKGATFKVTLRGATREYAKVWSVNGRSLGAGQVQTSNTGSTTEVTLGFPQLGAGLNKVTFMVEDRRNVLLPVGSEYVGKVPHTVSWWVLMAGPPRPPGLLPLVFWP